MADPSIEDILAAYGQGTDPVVNTQMPSTSGLGFSSSANQARGPWMRRAMEKYPQGKELADFFAGLMNYGPAAVGARGGVGAAALEHQAPNPAIMDRMRQGLMDRTDDLSMWSATQPVRYPEAAYTVRKQPANTNKALRPGQDPHQIETDPYTQATIDQQWNDLVRKAAQQSPSPPTANELAGRPNIVSSSNLNSAPEGFVARGSRNKRGESDLGYGLTDILPFKRRDQYFSDVPGYRGYEGYGQESPWAAPGGARSDVAWANDFHSNTNNAFTGMPLDHLLLSRQHFQRLLGDKDQRAHAQRALGLIEQQIAKQRSKFSTIPGDKPE